MDKDKKEYIWLSPMTNAPTPTEKDKVLIFVPSDC